MTVAASALITQARRLLLDDTDLSITDAAFLSYLNEGIRRFASETHVCQLLYNATLTTATCTFASMVAACGNASVDSILQITKVELREGAQYSTLLRGSFLEGRSKLPVATTTPTRFYTFGDTFITDLHPSATISLDVTFYFSFVPVDLSTVADTSIQVPVVWHPALVKYMAFCAHLVNRDTGLANGAFGDYELMRQQAVALTVARVS
jgi:hypothetical protein